MSAEFKEEINEDEEDNGRHIFDYLIILAKHKKLIILLTLPVAIISLVLTLFNNYFYQATTSIFPSQKQEISMARQLMGQFGIFAGRNGGNMYNNQKLFVAIIRSRTFSERLIERFNLQKEYGEETKDQTRKSFLKKIRIKPDFTGKKRLKSNDSPLMKITVFNQNPQRAADIANAIVEELNIFINDIAISKVSQKRLFFENQLKQASDALIESEEDMKAFQEKTGIMAVGDQMNITIDKFAPALMLEYKRVFRQLKFNETMYGIIVKQYEAAKLDEAKDATLIQVIDKAVPFNDPFKMRTWGRKKALATTILAFLFSCFLAFALEYYERVSMQYRAKSNDLKQHLSFKKNK